MAATVRHDTYPIHEFRSQTRFFDWMAKNHVVSEGIWLKIAKAGSAAKTLTYAEAVNVSLCYGWIDGLRRTFDKDYFLQKYTPRRGNSIWSAINKRKVDVLIKEGRMQQAGLDAIETAKKNGRWEAAYDSQKTITVSAERQKALQKNKKAGAFFKTLNSQNRYAVLFRIHQAKKPETRNKRIEQFVAMLERHETIYPMPDKKT